MPPVSVAIDRTLIAWVVALMAHRMHVVDQRAHPFLPLFLIDGEHHACCDQSPQ